MDVATRQVTYVPGMSAQHTFNSPPLSALSRRRFLQFAGYGLALAPLGTLLSCGSGDRRGGEHLVSQSEGLLDLLPGLTLTVLDRKGTTLGDGFLSPARPDGMACFGDEAGRWTLMRNHEIDQDDIGTSDGLGPYELDSVPAAAYSRDSLGGVTRLVLNPRSLEVVESNVVLAGTRKNCAGGATPMGWLSCEESLDDEGNHGFVYLCDAEATSLQPAVRLDQYGRFLHEAAGFDPVTGICYLTEDHPESCLYRFLPNDPSQPFNGRLQALRIVDRSQFVTSTLSVGQAVEADWIDVPDPLAGLQVAPSCQALGAATIARGEGCWFDDGRLVFAATAGGAAATGQIFELRDTPASTILRSLAEGTESDGPSRPDNVVIGPDGAVYFAEDNKGDCLIQRLTADGVVEPIARNTESGEEIAGLCFSPDGSVLFANIQEPGITMAITGL